MKIIHTADWHIGQTFFGYDRTEEHQAFLDWLTDRITILQIDVLLICGDIFDVANPSAHSQRQFYHFLKTVSATNPGLQIIIVAGNHDSAARLETPTPLLEEMNISIRGLIRRQENGEIDTGHLLLELKNRRGKREGWCLAVPYLRQGDYPPVDTDRNPYQTGVKGMYDTLLSAVRSRRQPGEVIIATGHLQAKGCPLSGDDLSERLIIGGLEGIPSDTFSPEIAYTALGHIHREQWVGGRKDIRYAGSPLPMSFAEENYHHGVIFLETHDGRLTHQEKLPFTPLVTLMRVPRQPAPLSEVLKLLALLPEEDLSGPAPYLEVRVLLTQPEPALRSRIEEALQHKQARLTRVLPFYPTDGSSTEKPNFTTDELMNPWKMVQSVYEKKYHRPFPDTLARLFHKALEDSYSKLGDHENITR